MYGCTEARTCWGYHRCPEHYSVHAGTPWSIYNGIHLMTGQTPAEAPYIAVIAHLDDTPPLFHYRSHGTCSGNYCRRTFRGRRISGIHALYPLHLSHERYALFSPAECDIKSVYEPDTVYRTFVRYILIEPQSFLYSTQNAMKCEFAHRLTSPISIKANMSVALFCSCSFGIASMILCANS